jgi:Cdc6-like AAA superfamily ATPase
MKPTNMRNWLWNYQTEKKVAFSEGTIEMLQAAGEKFSTGVDEHRGATTASLIMAALDLGSNRPHRDRFLEKFYRSVGAERFKQMRSRFGEGEMAGPEIDEAINQKDSTLSPTVARIISASAERPSGNDSKILPIDLLVSLAEDIGAANQTTPSCQQLVGESEPFLPLLCEWLSPLIQEPDIPVSLEEAFRRIEFSVAQGRERPAFLQVSPQALDQLTKFWDSTAIRPGNALSEALTHLCARKQNLPPATTPGLLLLGLLQRGENISHGAPNSDRTLEILLLRRLFGHGLKLAELWNRDGVKYAEASKRPEPNRDLSAVLKLAAELEGACSPGSVYVAPRHFVAALVHLWRQAQIEDLKEILPLTLADLEESLKVHLPVFEDKDRQDVWEAFLTTGALPPLTSPDGTPLEADDPVQIGTKSDFSRDSTSIEVDDDTRKLARAIASTFKSDRTGDFCFGLFGPWGRGKTTLIREVAGELRDDHVAVPFNAWKYPARPEVWVWLYESIKAQASGTDLWNRLRIGIQSNLRRDPGFGILLAGFLLLFAAISKGQLTGWLIPLDNLAALLALAALIFYGYRLWNSFGTLLRDYLKMPNHGRHLGLQAAIGDDLKHLLATWTGVEPSPNRNPTSQNNSPLSLPSTRWRYFKALIGWHWPFAVGVGLVVTSLIWMLFRVWEPADWPLRVILIGAAATSLFGFVAVLLPPKRAKQILLIVDDLDRCPPDEMLSVIESLRVFLDDPAISSHLKVAMLLDREILAHAICRKFENLIQANVPKTDRPNPTQDAPARFTRDGIVAEQIEKCFILSFDMPPLASASSWKIASNIVGYTESTEEPNSAAESDKPSARSSDEQEGRRSRSTTAGPAERTKPVETTPTDSSVTDHSGSPTQESLEPPPPVKEVHLGEDEKKAMVRLLHSLLTTDPAHATPRRMRMIKMRYYLARQILRAQETPFMPEELLKHFSGIYIDRKLDPRLAEVVGMVTGTAPRQ